MGPNEVFMGPIHIVHKIQRIMCTNNMGNYENTPKIWPIHHLKLFLHVFTSMGSQTNLDHCQSLGIFDSPWDEPLWYILCYLYCSTMEDLNIEKVKDITGY